MIAASQGAAATDATRRKPFVASRKKNSVLDNRCCAGASSQSYQIAHEGAVDAPAEEQLDDGLDEAEQRQRAVVLLRQVLDVDAEEQEVDDLDGDVAEPVDRQVPGELADLLQQGRLRVCGTSAGSGSTIPEPAAGG